MECYSRADVIDWLERICDDTESDSEYILSRVDEIQPAVAPVQRWISVDERLPRGADESGVLCQNVCLKMDDGFVTAGWMNGITQKVYYLDTRDDFILKAPISRVTHWKPFD